MNKLDLKKVSAIVLHQSDSAKCSKDDLYQWHVLDNGWDDIGYHYLIRLSGERIDCRPLKYAGAHVKGANDHTIGICLEGRGNFEFTNAQLQELNCLIKELIVKVPWARISGHYEYDSAIAQGKTCPMAEGEKFSELLGRLKNLPCRR